ncbi:hypothetical protein [Roseobacter sp. GAI101]|uniref:hypothetical protein n=1 Tax=Roseobacter sp. (strain GAI101) TaxID=391589 RepID=UPI00018714F8|nr:hypothetical protein [Roseobacter sp. GAI101]EEB83407.1 hypothetical protein RGAI101_556 [Roseobacter sp. GAI101]
MIDREARLRHALAAALERYDDRVGETFPYEVGLLINPDDAFLAIVRPDGAGISIEATLAVVTLIEEVWAAALDLSNALPNDSQIALLGDHDHVVDIALRWLMQHELNHVAVGHFKLSAGAGIVEGGGLTQFALATQKQRPASPLDQLNASDRKLAPLCLELQADHDATEIVLGAYFNENHELFRYYAICIALVIFVIERIDREQGNREISHPKASTRLFMLLAYLVELPYIPAYKRAAQEGLEHMPEEYLPDKTEVQQYSKVVVGPVFAACEIIAEAVELPNILDELGGTEAFFADIQTAVLGGQSDIAEFKTECAKQWAALKPLNDRLLKILGW